MFTYSHRYPPEDEVEVTAEHGLYFFSEERGVDCVIGLHSGTRIDLVPSVNESGNNLFYYERRKK